MEVKVCRVCKRMFNFVYGDNICPICKEKEENVFQEVKEYIREHNGASEAEICDKFEVSAKTIRQWIKEERLEIVKGSALSPHCKRCGAEIITGDLCEECKKAELESANALSNSIKKPVVDKVVKKEPSGNKMRFLNR